MSEIKTVAEKLPESLKSSLRTHGYSKVAAALFKAAGHRINAISAGPIRTLAASQVPGFDDILDYMEHTAPLKRNVDQVDIAKTAIFLLSDLASGITGQTIFVDSGFNIMGVPPEIDTLGKK